MFELTYTPVDKTGNVKSEVTVTMNGYDNITELFDDVKSGMTLFQPVEKGGAHKKECVASKIGLSKDGTTYWNVLESLRRSSQWHDAVNAYTDDASLVNKLVLDVDGRDERGSTAKRVNVSVDLPDNKRVNPDVENDDATVSLNKAGDVLTITWKIAVRDYTPAERATTTKKATLEEYVAYVATVDTKPLTLDEWMLEQNDND